MTKQEWLTKSGPYPYNIIQTWTRPRYFVGHRDGMAVEVFSTTSEPTVREYGDQYDRVDGPFRTRRGAQYLLDNPHCIGNTAKIERMARAEKKAFDGIRISVKEE